MKKIISLLVLAMVLTLVACGGKTEKAAPAEAAGKKITLNVIAAQYSGKG